MSIMQILLILVPALALLSCGLLPRKLANQRVESLRRFIAGLGALQCIAAITALASLLGGLLRGGDPVTIKQLLPSIASLHLDGFSLLMLCLVSFVGFVVTHYSVRYLDGDANQGNYFRWLATTIGGVSLFAVSGNLLMLFAAWAFASFGLHQLLVHYSDRPAASNAAWTKFAFSRMGDLLLVSAIALIYREFGTLELANIFAELKGGVDSSTSLNAIAWLLMLAAVAKSAQFPFHSWLPNTLEAPTPVSALMHAGIVNAGGYLAIRLSPLIVEAPVALGMFAIIGSITVCYAGIVMMTQSSIKRSLAYSTIAQMGFMMLQCGIGAFSAAMLHILAHSLYKAYAFLNSGSVLAEAEGQRAPKADAMRARNVADYAGGIMLAAIGIVLSSMLFGINLAAKPGGIVIGFVLTLSIAAWLWDVFRLNSIRSTTTGLVTAGGLPVLYMAGYFPVNQVVSGSVPDVQAGLMQTIATTDVFVVFCALFVVNCLLASKRGREILAPLYVHAANGFYLDAMTQRALSSRKT